ncbi:MAG: hypothetical protein JO314_10415 [Acidobacteria bacterium]|nr:hypothetical protein [Acidobacteriota bacterium]
MSTLVRVIVAMSIVIPSALSQDQTPSADLVVQTGHGSEVNCVVFSPNGRVLASGGSKVKLHDVATGKELRTMTLHGSVVWSLAYNEKLVAAGGFDINLFDAATGENVGAWRGHGYGVTALAFSPDGKTLASGDQSLWLWDYTNAQPSLGEFDIQAGKPGIELKGHKQPVTSVAFSRDGKLLASASKDKTVILWAVANKKALVTLIGHSGAVNAVRFSPDGKFVVTGSDDKTVRIWSVASGQQIAVLTGHSAKVNSVAYSGDGGTIVSAGDDKTVRTWSVASKRQIKMFAGEKPVLSVAVSADGKWIASGGDDEAIHFFDPHGILPERVVSGPTASIFATAFSPDGRTLVTGGKQVVLWDLYGHSDLRTIAEDPDIITALSFSPDGKLLAGADHKRMIRIWDLSTGANVKTIPDPPIKPPANELEEEQEWFLSLSADNKQLARELSNGEIKIWNLETGATSGPFNGRLPEVKERLKATFPDLFQKLPSLISETDKLFAQPTMGFNSIVLIRKISNEQLVNLVALDKTHWVMIADDGRFDTNQDFEAINGVHWVFSNDPFTPVPLETLMRQYYEPNLFSRQMSCIDNRDCPKEFQRLPEITQVDRARPRLVIEDSRK